MNILKKTVATILLMIIILTTILPTISYGEELNDKQRKAMVDVVVTMIEEGNRKRLLRYSQDHRMSGYNWRKTTSGKQTTVSSITLTPELLAGPVSAALKVATGNEAATAVIPKYACKIIGADISDTIAFDCSSLVCAAYNMTVGTKFKRGAWTTEQFKNSSNLYNVSSDVSSAKPGDILWKQGHVALYLGDYDKDKKDEIAEAYGIMATKNSKYELALKLSQFLVAHPEYIYENPASKALKSAGKMPVIEIPASAIRDATHQVVISEVNLSSGKFKKVASYKGTIEAGRAIDVSGTNTSNTGEGSDSDKESGTIEGDRNGNGAITLPGMNGNQTYWPKDLKIGDENLVNSKGYFYKGTPTYGQYAGKIDMFNWFIKGAGNMLDWIIGFITMAIRVQLIGWTAILENSISEVLNFGTRDITEEKREDSDIFVMTSDKKITIEDVLFNRVPLLDVNFFDFKNAGGQELSQNSLIYKVREAIAGWYYTLRMIVIIGMLIALIYIAIKMAASTIAVEKAQYKRKLIDWFVGFIVVFMIHYFMLGVIMLNNQLVKILDPQIKVATTVPEDNKQNDKLNIHEKIELEEEKKKQENNEMSIYENVRIQSYDIQAGTGWTATIIYMVLVFYLIRFLILYVKRLFTLAILTVIAPIMGVMYAINKKQSPISEWGKEYGFNVIIQFLHAILYTVLVSIALQLARTSTFKGAILAAIALGFIFSAEALLKKIFNFGKSKSLSNLSDSTLAHLAAYKVGKTLIDKSVGVIGRGTNKNPKKVNLKEIPRDISTSNNKTNMNIGSNVTGKINSATTLADKNAKLAQTVAASNAMRTAKVNGLNYIVDKNGTPIRPVDESSKQYKTMSNIKAQIEEKRIEESKARKAYAHQSLKDGTQAILGGTALMAAIPMLILEPKAGLGMGMFGISSMSSAFGRRVKGPKKGQNQKFSSKRLMFALASGGVSLGLENMYNNAEDEKKFLMSKYPKELEALKEAREEEDKLIRELEALGITCNADMELNEMHTREAIKKIEKLEEVTSDIDKREFEQALNATLNTVTIQDIEKVVKEYAVENQVIDITEKHIEEITVKVNDILKEKRKNISLSAQFSENIREEVRNRIKKAGNYITNDEVSKSNVDMPHGNENISNENETSKNPERTKVHIKEEREIRPIANVITEKELDKKVEEAIPNLKREEIIEIMDIALQKETSIERNIQSEKYKDVMKTVKSLKKTNDNYAELTGEPIYSSVKDLVKFIKRSIDKQERM